MEEIELQNAQLMPKGKSGITIQALGKANDKVSFEVVVTVKGKGESRQR